MSDPKKPDDRGPATAKLVSGILDGTYKNIESAHIALAKSRQTLSKRNSNFEIGAPSGEW
jgi:hypothetical protein